METQEGQFTVGDNAYSYFKIEMENAVEIFLYSEKERLGTVAVGTPLPEERRAVSSTMLGDRTRVSAAVAEAIAERFAVQKSKIAIVSCFLETQQTQGIEVGELLRVVFENIPSKLKLATAVSKAIQEIDEVGSIPVGGPNSQWI
jgi:hypothetical protein